VEPLDISHQQSDDYRLHYQRIYRSFPGLAAITPRAALEWCDQNGVSIPDRLREAIETHAPKPEIAAPKSGDGKATRRGRPPRERERIVSNIFAAIEAGRYESIDALLKEKQEVLFAEFCVSSPDTWSRAVTAARTRLASGSVRNSTV
jgi:hypothetical protein